MIRKATDNDTSKIAAIYENIHFKEESGEMSVGWVRTLYPTLKTAQKAVENGEMYVNDINGKIVAAAIINGVQLNEYKKVCFKYNAPDSEVLVLHTLVVEPSLMGGGYGKEFVNYYEQTAAEKNQIYLRIDTNVKNAAARALYKKLGFKEVGIVVSDFYGIGNVSLVILEKIANANPENYVGLLLNKDNNIACAACRKLCDISQNYNTVYKYFDYFYELLGNKNSLVRNRAIALLADNARYDTENKFEKIIDSFLLHITDEKPITARQCIKALPIIAKYKPLLMQKILSALKNADISGYKDSMRPLIDKDIKTTLKIMNGA